MAVSEGRHPITNHPVQSECMIAENALVLSVFFFESGNVGVRKLEKNERGK
jgi:hypothetical protein